MKILFTLIALFTMTLCHAQTEVTKYTYCKLNINPKSNIDASAKMKLLFGATEAMYPEGLRKILTTKVESLTTMLDAVNYMSSQGWEYVSLNTLPAGVGDVNASVFVVFRKDINKLE